MLIPESVRRKLCTLESLWKLASVDGVDTLRRRWSDNLGTSKDNGRSMAGDSHPR